MPYIAPMAMLCRVSVRWFCVLVVLSMLAVACGASDRGGDETSDAADGDDDASATDAGSGTASQAIGTLADTDLGLIVTELAAGFGLLGVVEQQTIDGLAEGDRVCNNVAGSRAKPGVSQIEVEIVTAVEGCLHFDYQLASFRSLVADINELRQGRNVLAVSPMLLEYKLDQIDSPWSTEAIDGSNLLERPEAPSGQDVVLAVIDSGIDVDDLGLENALVQRVPDSGQGDYAATGHGTIAAAIIVAPIVATGRAIAPNVRLLDVPADLCDQRTCGCDPCAEMTAAEAIRWSVDNGADIISMSFGYRPADKPAWWQKLLDGGEVASTTETIEISLAYAEAKGIAMTAAAGNCSGDAGDQCENEDQFEIPAGHRSVMAVGALEQAEDGSATSAWYSTQQPYVEIAAPGSVAILVVDGETMMKTGTSYATPFVSAALAVLMGSDGPLAGQPDMHTIARQLLTESAFDLAPVGRDIASGHGQLQLDPALEAAVEYATRNPPPPDEVEAE